MKTVAKLALAGLAVAQFVTGGAIANESDWRSIDNHHGSVTYIYRPTQKETTVAVYSRASAVGRSDSKSKTDEVRLKQTTTAHGAVSYFAPVQ